MDFFFFFFHSCFSIGGVPDFGCVNGARTN